MSRSLRGLLIQSILRGPATLPPPASDQGALKELALSLGRAGRKLLGRSLAIREIDAGSCNGCELEITALTNPAYDLDRLGFSFVASPKHADLLMVTGPVTLAMKTALERAYDVTPEPKWVVAVGDCACNGGVFAASPACVGAVSLVIPVDLHLPGCPPRPSALLSGLLALMETASNSLP